MMFKRIFYYFAGTCILLAATTLVVHAFVILTREQALKEVFPPEFQIKTETVKMSGDTLKRVQDRLGGSLIFEQEGSESAKVSAETSVEFLVAESGGEVKGVAIIDVQPGKWGPVEFITAIDTQGQVRRVRVMSYQEERGRPIAQASFMNQYRGMTSKSALTVGKDITGISGATISSRAATFAVKKAIVVFEEVYLKKK
jgi:Na+-translocating ferredoxin:NAD+ oxidoreductase RnfG subunit